MPITRLFISVFCLALVVCAGQAFADIRVTDDAGTVFELEQPASRIVSLSPHITELLFAAGAGESVVGVAAFSDYPQAAKSLPRISGGNGIDLEAIVALRPDLVIAWQSGNPAAQVERLKALGLRVFLSEPREPGDVADSLRRFGELAGTPDLAEHEAQAYLERLAHLRAQYADREPVSVFYQVWDRPLMTVNGEHIISKVISLCGGRNVFAELSTLAPQIGRESVLVADPEVIITGGEGGELDGWQQSPSLQAVKNNALYVVPAALLTRHTPRILDGAERVCGYLEAVRSRSE